LIEAIPEMEKKGVGLDVPQGVDGGAPHRKVRSHRGWVLHQAPTIDCHQDGNNQRHE
jgi:hypothetical protein